MPELPDSPPEETISGRDGRTHRFRYRLWRAPTGIVAEAEEADLAPREGYHFEVMGSHEADVSQLIDALRNRVRQGVSTLYLKQADHRHGWSAEGDEIRGRLEWNEEGGPYDVLIDGRRLSWEELGRALESFEGWKFTLRIEETDLIDTDATPAARLANVISLARIEKEPQSNAQTPIRASPEGIHRCACTER